MNHPVKILETQTTDKKRKFLIGEYPSFVEITVDYKKCTDNASGYYGRLWHVLDCILHTHNGLNDLSSAINNQGALLELLSCLADNIENGSSFPKMYKPEVAEILREAMTKIYNSLNASNSKEGGLKK